VSANLCEFERTTVRIRNKALAVGKLVDNPDDSDVRSILAREPGVRCTVSGNYVA